MEKEFVNYNQALKLKELGFDEPCFGYYSKGVLSIEIIKSGKIFTNEDSIYFDKDSSCSAPLFQQAFRWFREKYGLYSYLSPKLSYPDDTITGKYYINILCNKFDYDVDNDGVYLYEEAELACLEKLIEIVEQSKSE